MRIVYAAVFVALVGTAAPAAAQVQVTATWENDVISPAGEPVVWQVEWLAEIERNGVVIPCGPGTAVPQGPRTFALSCRLTVPALAGTYRVRIRNAELETHTEWGPEGSGGGGPPGAVTITQAFVPALTQPGGGSMALGRNYLNGNISTAGGTTQDTGSFSVTPGALVVAKVNVGGMGGAAATAITAAGTSGLSGSLTRVGFIDPPAGDLNDYVTWLFAGTLSGTTGAIRFSRTGGSSYLYSWDVVEVTGSSTPSVVGSAFTNTTPATPPGSPATSLTLTGPAFADPADRMLAFFDQTATSAGTTPSTGIDSELSDITSFFGGGKIQAVWGNANANAVTSNTGASPGAWTAIGIEITEGGGGATPAIVPARTSPGQAARLRR